MNNDKLNTITNLFEGVKIRSIWNSEKNEYYFSVIDVISALTDSNIPKRSWVDLKRKLIGEGSQLYDKIVRLKLEAQDGVNRKTDTLNTEGILRLIELVPSPKTESFKLWLSSLGKEQIDEMFAKKLKIDKNKLTDERDKFDIKHSCEYDILTNEIDKDTERLGGHATKVEKDDIEKNLIEPIVVKKNTLLYKYLRENTLREDK